MQPYREGYYDGWVACMSMIGKLTKRNMEHFYREPTNLAEDGTLFGELVVSAQVDAEDDCEDYAYSLLQDWGYGKIDQEQPPTFPENIVESEVTA